MLLIEFDQGRSFKFQGSYMLSNDPGGSGTFDIQKKLQLLTIHFPKLKIVWSPSPYASAQLFEELKVRLPLQYYDIGISYTCQNFDCLFF